MLSEACKNAIRAVVYLATQHDPMSRHTVREIAKAIEGPEPFVAKVLQDLRRHELISATKGPNGGMYITAAQARRSLLDIIKAIDGLQAFTQCGLGLSKCNANKPCPLHHDFGLLRDTLMKKYKQTSIAVLAREVEDGATVLHR